MSAGEGGGGLAKCLCYYISLCSKVAYGGGRGGQKLAKSCLRSLWMAPNCADFYFWETKHSLKAKLLCLTFADFEFLKKKTHSNG